MSRDLQFDFDDILIHPKITSRMNSRKTVNMLDGNGFVFYKKFRGISTKEVQAHLGNDLRSSQCVTWMNQVKYTLSGWVENFTTTSSRIVIVYADDKSEIIDLAPFKFNDDYLVKNNQVITQTLNKLRKSRYKIVTSTSNGKVTSSRNMLITTFILEKQNALCCPCLKQFGVDWCYFPDAIS